MAEIETVKLNEFAFYGAVEGDLFVDKNGRIDFVVLEEIGIQKDDGIVQCFRVKFLASNRIVCLDSGDLAKYCEEQFRKRLNTAFDVVDIESRKVDISKGELFFKDGVMYCEIMSDIGLYYDDVRNVNIPFVVVNYHNEKGVVNRGVSADALRRELFSVADVFKEQFTALQNSFNGVKTDDE